MLVDTGCVDRRSAICGADKIYFKHALGLTANFSRSFDPDGKQRLL